MERSSREGSCWMWICSNRLTMGPRSHRVIVSCKGRNRKWSRSRAGCRDLVQDSEQVQETITRGSGATPADGDKGDRTDLNSCPTCRVNGTGIRVGRPWKQKGPTINCYRPLEKRGRRKRLYRCARDASMGVSRLRDSDVSQRYLPQYR